jgi:thiosulfate/3-mercaptopyruvate sulfurtransferase
MNRFALFLVGLACAAFAQAAQPLLGAQQLATRLTDSAVRVIDIRDAQIHDQLHIPGAVSAPFDRWRGPAGNPGDLPPAESLAELLRTLGLTDTSHAVIVAHGTDANDFAGTARVYWTLKVLGLKRLSILDGGMSAWESAGLPLDTGPVSVAPGDFQPRLDSSMLADRNEVLGRIRARDATLVDSRSARFFRGEVRAPAVKIAGTLPDAVNLPHDRWLVPGTGRLLPVDQARQLADSIGADPGRDTIAFCNSGYWSATHWFAMSELLGRANVRMYPGSMVEWTSDREVLPMANLPGRIEHLLSDARMWVDRHLR